MGSLIEAVEDILSHLQAVGEGRHTRVSWHGDYVTDRCDPKTCNCAKACKLAKALRDLVKKDPTLGEGFEEAFA